MQTVPTAYIATQPEFLPSMNISCDQEHLRGTHILPYVLDGHAAAVQNHLKGESREPVTWLQ